MTTKRTNATSPLRCAKDGSESVTVSGVQQMLRRDGTAGVAREFARCTCDTCGHEWWSRHPEALKLSRQVDKARTEGTGHAHGGQ